MGTIQIIEEIKKLSPQERGEISAFLKQLDQSEQITNYASDQEAQKAGKWVVDNYKPLLEKLAK